MNSVKLLNFVVLAAGKGTRMNSDLPKVMHNIADMPMINILLNEVKSCNPKHCHIVVSHEGKKIVESSVEKVGLASVSAVVQEERLGTGHAAKIALDSFPSDSSKGVLIILYGDTPFISKETIFSLEEEISSGNAVSIVGFDAPYENEYGRLVVDSKGSLKEIVEFKDANQEQKNITLCNSGIMALDLKLAGQLLSEIKDNNAKKEFYLTDIVAIAKSKGLMVSHIIADELEVQGINNKVELAKANKYYFSRIRDRVMQQGVTLIDPETTYLSADTVIGKDVVIEPNVTILSGVKIGNNVRIKSFSHIESSDIGDDVSVGPFARIRPGSKLDNGARIGNFVEIKNSNLGVGAKVNHLSYIGDTDLGSDVNVGAGAITCNYDGYKKYKTKIGSGVFIGSNTALIAPIEVGDRSIVAAGSTITRDIPEDSITISRLEQKDIIGGATKYRNKKKEA